MYGWNFIVIKQFLSHENLQFEISVDDFFEILWLKMSKNK